MTFRYQLFVMSAGASRINQNIFRLTYRQCYAELIRKLSIKENAARLKYFDANGVQKYLSEEERARFFESQNEVDKLMKKIDQLDSIISSGKASLSDEADSNLLGFECEKEK